MCEYDDIDERVQRIRSSVLILRRFLWFKNIECLKLRYSRRMREGEGVRSGASVSLFISNL